MPGAPRPRTPSRGAAPILVRGLRVALLAVVVTGCARTASYPNFRGSAGMGGSLVVNVENQHFSDVVVYVSTGGQWQRLGDVTGTGKASLVVPSGLHSPGQRYRFRVHPIGGQDRDDYVTELVYADRGDIVEIRVAGLLRMSSWWIR